MLPIKEVLSFPGGAYPRVEKPLAYLGPEGSFSHELAVKLAEKSKLVMKESFSSILEFVENERECVGLIPIFNTVSGIVSESIQEISSKKLHVMHVLAHDINLSLLAIEGTSRDNIRRIASHPAALRVGAEWIQKNNWEAVQASSTSAAAKMVKSERSQNFGILGSPTLVSSFSLELLEKDISGIQKSKTIFLLVRC